MTATNHALTGALIGLSVANPVAVLLAVVSHFALDALPHYTDESVAISSRTFAWQLAAEASLCFSLVVFLAIARPEHWLLASFCAFAAASPDFMWIPKYFRARRGQPEPEMTNWVLRFHHWIQWFTRPAGALVEIVWFAGALVLLANHV